MSVTHDNLYFNNERNKLALSGILMMSYGELYRTHCSLELWEFRHAAFDICFGQDTIFNRLFVDL